jgi:hypothetical protein
LRTRAHDLPELLAYFRKPDPTGRTSWVTDGPTWCRRIATLIPPRAHKLRAFIVPSPTSVTDPWGTDSPTAMTVARHLDWASLLRRVWGSDVTTCPSCVDTLGMLAFITHPDVIGVITGGSEDVRGGALSFIPIQTVLESFRRAVTAGPE